jgi:hypothetical protein
VQVCGKERRLTQVHPSFNVVQAVHHAKRVKAADHDPLRCHGNLVVLRALQGSARPRQIRRGPRDDALRDRLPVREGFRGLQRHLDAQGRIQVVLEIPKRALNHRGVRGGAKQPPALRRQGQFRRRRPGVRVPARRMHRARGQPLMVGVGFFKWQDTLDLGRDGLGRDGLGGCGDTGERQHRHEAWPKGEYRKPESHRSLQLPDCGPRGDPQWTIGNGRIPMQASGTPGYFSVCSDSGKIVKKTWRRRSQATPMRS